jgi:hypothetical protein
MQYRENRNGDDVKRQDRKRDRGRCNRRFGTMQEDRQTERRGEGNIRSTSEEAAMALTARRCDATEDDLTRDVVEDGVQTPFHAIDAVMGCGIVGTTRSPTLCA